MSHSSKLMTLDVMIQNLTCLKRYILSEEITVSAYLSLFDSLAELEHIKAAIEELTLVLEVDDGQETAQKTFDFMVERPRAGQRSHSNSLRWELLPYEFNRLLDCLRNPVIDAE